MAGAAAHPAGEQNVKGEYLHFEFDDQTFHAIASTGSDVRFRAETEGNIVRAGLNFHF